MPASTRLYCRFEDSLRNRSLPKVRAAAFAGKPKLRPPSAFPEHTPPCKRKKTPANTPLCCSKSIPHFLISAGRQRRRPVTYFRHSAVYASSYTRVPKKPLKQRLNQPYKQQSHSRLIHRSLRVQGIASDFLVLPIQLQLTDHISRRNGRFQSFPPLRL